MKKELLIASALVSTLGAASVANAVTASTSGSHHTGLRGSSSDAGTADTITPVTHVWSSDVVIGFAITSRGEKTESEIKCTIIVRWES